MSDKNLLSKNKKEKKKKPLGKILKKKKQDALVLSKEKENETSIPLEEIKLPVSDQVLFVLEKEILLGKYAIGDKIPAEAELVKSFGMSRNSVREGLKGLIHAGLLESRQGSGTYVVASNRMQVELAKFCEKEDQEEILELKEVLLRFFLKNTQKRMSSFDIKELEVKLNALKTYRDELGPKPLHLVSKANKSVDETMPEKTEKQNHAEIAFQETHMVLHSLEYDFMSSFFGIARNNVIAKLFLALHNINAKKCNVGISLFYHKSFKETLPLYEEIVNALKENDTKRIKKVLEVLF